MCLYFAAQGAGKVVGPVLAATSRLVVIALGGLVLTSLNTPEWTLYALVGIAMMTYGLLTFLAVYVSRWG